MQSHLKPKLPDMLIAVDFRDGSSLKAIWEDLYVQYHTYQPKTVGIDICVLAHGCISSLVLVLY